MSALHELRSRILDYSKSCPDNIRRDLESICGHADLTPHPIYSRYLIGRDGKVVGPSGKVLRSYIGPHGYPCVNVIFDNQKGRKQVRVHVLVCETYHGLKPAGKHLIAHNDGNRLNFRADNLRWATYVENEADKRSHGRLMTGERHHRSKLTESDVRLIRSSQKSGNELSRQLGISQNMISRIRLRKNWRHI
jgi:hypothetical protein